jgi:hypothetical protein
MFFDLVLPRDKAMCEKRLRATFNQKRGELFQALSTQAIIRDCSWLTQPYSVPRVAERAVAASEPASMHDCIASP